MKTSTSSHVIAYEINYEDETMYCDHCNEKIESAYGEED